jgi:tetratricopeptide (TPR) repeat protein
MDDRERKFKELVAEFPDSPMGHFSLGKHLLELRRWEEAARSLEEAVRLDPEYAAALLALGDAQAAQGQGERARGTYELARLTPLGQRDPSFLEDLEARLAEL